MKIRFEIATNQKMCPICVSTYRYDIQQNHHVKRDILDIILKTLKIKNDTVLKNPELGEHILRIMTHDNEERRSLLEGIKIELISSSNLDG